MWISRRSDGEAQEDETVHFVVSNAGLHVSLHTISLLAQMCVCLWVCIFKLWISFPELSFHFFFFFFLQKTYIFVPG